MNVCNICLNELAEGCSVRRCDVCRAEHHVECWERWMRVGNGCPSCRHCVQNELLRSLIPDIPEEVCTSLTSFEKYNLCRIALLIALYNNLARSRPS